MIFNGQYQIYSENVSEDGEKTRTLIPPKVFLSVSGPIIPVSIHHHPKILEKLKTNNQMILQPLAINALIDTGAAISIITPEVSEKLNLLHVGYTKIRSVQDEQKRPTYLAQIIFSWGKVFCKAFASCPIGGRISCIIGRDVLASWHFTYNGTNGSITICD